ncbi:MAG TPA: VOC family protein [Rhizomicrobium sp.]|nr:VOC family protein [Rhizomicrobium sp.]
MINYVTIGTNDLEKAKAFYGPLLAELGGKPAWASERMQGYASKAGMVAICTPHDGKAASVGNGSMFGLAAPDRAAVDRIYAKAMALGASDEGAPGARTDNFYGAYFRDLDGNKLCVYKVG